jgi:hypothetical protein
LSAVDFGVRQRALKTELERVLIDIRTDFDIRSIELQALAQKKQL